MQKAKRFAVAMLVAAIGTLVPTVFSGTAHAAAPDCKTTTTTLSRPDHGHGTTNGGYWANLTITRTTTICVTPVVQAESVSPPKVIQYKAIVKDSGTFVTIAGVHLSPNDGKYLKGGVPGVVFGDFTQNFVAEKGWLKYQGNFNGQTYSGLNNPVSTGNWVKAVWGGDDFKSEGINDDWTWTYQTCVKEPVKSGWVEMWWDSSDKNSDDGQANSAGDITGKPCPSATQSPTPTPTVSATVTAVPTVPSLPVTGANVPMLVGGGSALLVAGAAIVGVLYMRRRRDRVRFVA